MLIALLLTCISMGQKLPFQGKLIELGTPVEGVRTFEFEITSLGWGETHSDVLVTEGLYFIVLGSINPLPDSLFFGVEEQEMAISVDGTPLSSVTLYKPLSSPYDWSAVSVRNSEGNVVGSMHALNDSVNKNGELKLYGNNGSLNVSLSSSGLEGNSGDLALYNTNGDVKSHFYVANGGAISDGLSYNSFTGDGGGWIYNTFKFWEEDEGGKRPVLGFSSGEIYQGLLMEINKSDTVEYGEISFRSNTGELNRVTADAYTLEKNGMEISKYFFHDWLGNGPSAMFYLNGPDTRNIELCAKYWIDPNLPWFKLIGSQNQDAIQMSVDENDSESAYINLYSLDGHLTSMHSKGINFNTIDSVGIEGASINVENRNELGNAGYFNINGPQSSNFYLGTRDWEDANLPLMNLHGKDNFHAMEISVSVDGDENQFGYINLMSENGKNLNLSPERIGIEKVSLFEEPNDSTKVGHIQISGENTLNLSMGGKYWEGNGDLPYFHMFGTDDGNGNFHAIDISLDNDEQETGYINLSQRSGNSTWLGARSINMHSPDGERLASIKLEDDGQGNEWGKIELTTYEKKMANIESRLVALTDFDNTWRDLASMSINNDSEAGWAGFFNLLGPTTMNIEAGAHWDSRDRPYLNLNGASDEKRIGLSVDYDDQENEWGTLDLHGATSDNLSLGSRSWEGSPDLPVIHMYGENSFYGIELSMGHNEAEQQFGYLNLMSESGKNLYLSPESGLGVEGVGMRTESNENGNFGYLNTSGPSTTNLETGGHWDSPDRPFFNMNGANNETRISVSVNYDDQENEWGTMNLRGPGSNNIEIGARNWEDANIPFVWMQGTEDFTAIELSLDSNYPEAGYIHLMDKTNRRTWLGSGGLTIDKSTGEQIVSLRNESDGENEWGFMEMSSHEGKMIAIEPRSVILRDIDNTWNDLASISINNDSGNGWAGYLNLRGSNSNNIEFSTRSWESTDLPMINLNGQNDFRGMEISVAPDVNTAQEGFINMWSENESTMNLNPNSISFNTNSGTNGTLSPTNVGIEKASISLNENENGSSSEMYLWGDNSPNIQMGSQSWENHDLAVLNLFTDKPDGSGWFYIAASISAGADETDSWGSMDLCKNDESKITLDGYSGNITISGTLSQSSDVRLKKDINPLSNALSNLEKLRGVSYYWKTDGTKTDAQIGMIAQEVELVYPEFVKTKEDGFKTLNYSQMVAVLVEAMKEMNSKIKILETENNELKVRLTQTLPGNTEIENLKEQVKNLYEKVQMISDKNASNPELITSNGLK